MFFKNLENKCLYYRSLTDYKLLPNSYVIVMLDGKNFSTLIKNKFKKPFDEDFIDMMNQTAQYVCENVDGCKFAYIQSDEISLVLTDFDTPTTDSFFGYRLNKLTSIIASLATAKFNQLMFQYKLKKHDYERTKEDSDLSLYDIDDAINFIGEQDLFQFDCKCWNVPNMNDVYAWFLYRQIDCLRNSKQQTVQTYLPHKRLLKLNTDEQINLLLKEKGIDWNSFSMSEKYGRFIWRHNVLMNNIETNEIYYCHKWLVTPAFPLMAEDGREKFYSIGVIPNNE